MAGSSSTHRGGHGGSAFAAKPSPERMAAAAVFEIGYALGLADNTVSAHLNRALDRLGLRSRTELVTLATQVAADFARRTAPRGCVVMKRAQ